MPEIAFSITRAARGSLHGINTFRKCLSGINSVPTSFKIKSAKSRISFKASGNHFSQPPCHFSVILLKSPDCQFFSCGCQHSMNHSSGKRQKTLVYGAICDTAKYLISMPVGLKITRRKGINLATLLLCSHYVQCYDSISMLKRLFGMNINCENGHEYCKRFYVLKDRSLGDFRPFVSRCDGT